MKKIFTYPAIFIVIISFLPLLPLLVPGLPVTHDGQDHVARIANFYQNLKEEVIVPRWAANLNWGYGHPILMFLYPLPSYVSSVFHSFGFSLVDSVKLVFGLSFIASALTMYLWMKTAFGRTAGIFGALLYTFAPYRFVDIYVRGALGEHVAFIFPPLVFYFLLQLAHQKKHVWSTTGLSLSFAALILSHNAIALMFIPVFFFYGMYVYFFEAKSRLLFTVHSLLFTALGFSLSAFFWVPAFFEGKYTLRDIVTGQEALQRFVPWSRFIYSSWKYGAGDELTKSLGLVQWIGVILGIFVIITCRIRKTRVVLIGAFVLLFSSLFIMTDWSKPIWLTLTVLQKFQFPWRFLSISVFTAAVLGGIAIKHGMHTILNHKRITKNTQLSAYCFLLIVYCLLLIVSTSHMWFPKAYQLRHESFYSGVFPSTTDTGESSPIWSIRSMEHTPDQPMSVISGNATILQLSRMTTKHEYTIHAQTLSRIVENTLYFPGWKIYVDGLEPGLQFQDPAYRGLMTFRVTEGKHTVRVIFENTKLRYIANVLSLFSVSVLIVGGFGGLLWKKRK